MPPKATRFDWKSGVQLEFLLTQEARFRRCQDEKTLDRFWPKVFEEWYHQWPIVPSIAMTRKHGSPEAARMMMQQEKNTQIKSWFNNCGRGAESAKAGRSNLKLDVNEKRKLAPVQAYCSYAWKSTLEPIVLARWEREKTVVTFADDEDPPSDAEGSSAVDRIPLAFKLKIAKELFVDLSSTEKKAIDVRREEDRQKLYCKITEIPDDGERKAKLKIHEKNQPLVAKSLLRVLTNLEDQTGCIAQVFVASLSPQDGKLQVQKHVFCQGRSVGKLDFETFYGDDWDECVERRFNEWALRVFGAKGSKQRNQFLLSPETAARLEEQPSEELSRNEPEPEIPLPAQSTSSHNSSTRAASSKQSALRLAALRKSTSGLAASQEPQNASSLLPASHESTSGASTAGIPLRPGISTFQITSAPDLSAAPSSPTSTGPGGVEPFQPAVSTSQPSVKPSQPAVSPSQLGTEPSQVLVEPLQPASVSSHPPPEETTMDAQLHLAPATIPSQSLGNAVVPKVSYRVRNSARTTAGTHSRRGSMSDAPERISGLFPPPQVQDVFGDDDLEVSVDLRQFIDVNSFVSLNDDSEAGTQVPSSQETADRCKELPPPSSDPTVANHSQPPPTHTCSDMDVDEGDLPAWMVKHGQWKYIASTAGGHPWENLLKAYMRQERRLEFMDMGVTLTNEDRPPKISEYFQYAHRPSRGDTVVVPGFGTEVVSWWGKIQPEWRRSGQDPPRGSSAWSYVLSGGSKGLFLVLMCLSWWDRAHARYLEGEKARRIEAVGAGVTPNFDDLADHDPEWLRVVDDLSFVMAKAQDCDVPKRGMSTPSRRAKRNREAEPDTPRKRAAAGTTLKRTRSKA
ncbi:hypothetical protein BJ322DRAFT_1113226 [Thelephora terrestris]|uniref:Uncharacterized protein n=1 Tax=Thelephora terrestris TaxID=56493 RepID=A0A9P6H512_9AGAM|nr:hypothetical protein BJ322DRAFT_1113226 [Thelephora terrestris]